MKKKSFFKSALTLLLTFTLVFSSFSVVFVNAGNSAPVVLTKNNVYEWPTVSGELWFGQYPHEELTLSGGIVTTDGTADGEVIPGRFEIFKLPQPPSATPALRVFLNFIPDDTEAYTGFTRVQNSSLKVVVHSVTPVFVDEVNDPIIASDIEVGDNLSSSILSGGQLMNPVVPTEEKISSAKWVWVDGSTVVTQSGYYQARSYTDVSYEVLYRDVWVNVKSGTTEIEIKNIPAFDFSYDGETKWSDLDLSGAVAVEKGTETVVDGTFSIVSAADGSSMPNIVIPSGAYDVYLKFTPDDTDKYVSCLVPLTVNVSEGIPAWKNGEIPVVKVPFGKKITDDTFNSLKQYTNLDITLMLRLYDAENNRLADGVSNLPCGTYDTEYKLNCRAGVANSNWGSAFLPVIIVVEPGEAHIRTAYYPKNDELFVYVDSKYLDGTFDIYIDGELAFDDAPITKESNSWYYKTTWRPADTTQDSSHSIKVVYNAAETDNAYIAEAFESTFVFQAHRKLTSDDYHLLNVSTVENGKYDIDPAVQWGLDKYLFAGDEVTIRAPYDGFLYWEITDSNGNAVEDLEIVRGGMDKNYITFKMPNYDLHINYMNQTEFDRIEAIKNCKCLCHSDNAFVQFFWNIINQILRILNQLFGYESVCDCGIVHGLDAA